MAAFEAPKEDFQAVDIASIARPVTKMATTVLEAAQVPGVLQQAFHLMRSGRPGPVLVDLPVDVRQTEIEFDPETYAPLPVYQSAATRARIEKALTMLNGSHRPPTAASVLRVAAVARSVFRCPLWRPVPRRSAH